MPDSDQHKLQDDDSENAEKEIEEEEKRSEALKKLNTVFKKRNTTKPGSTAYRLKDAIVKH